MSYWPCMNILLITCVLVCHVDRSAKKLAAELKEALKTRDPWEKEIGFLRNKLSTFNIYLMEFIHNLNQLNGTLIVGYGSCT